MGNSHLAEARRPDAAMLGLRSQGSATRVADKKVGVGSARPTPSMPGSFIPGACIYCNSNVAAPGPSHAFMAGTFQGSACPPSTAQQLWHRGKSPMFQGSGIRRAAHTPAYAYTVVHNSCITTRHAILNRQLLPHFCVRSEPWRTNRLLIPSCRK